MRVFEGDLYRDGEYRTPLRPQYAWHFRQIDNGAQLRSCLRAGEYAWPGGYRLFFVTSDGAALSFDAVKRELYQVTWSVRNQIDDGWRVVGLDSVECSDDPVYCDYSGELID